MRVTRVSSTAAVVLGALIAGSLVAPSPSALGARPEPRTAPLAVTGYVLAESPPRLVTRDAHALASVGVDGVTITSDGARVHTPTASAVRLLRTANDRGLRADLLVSNYSSTLYDFDPEAGARLLGSAENIDHVTDRLTRIVETQGWDGVTIDLESLAAADGPGLTEFARQLKAKLPDNCKVSIDLMASTSLSDYRAGGYQLAALGRVVDVVALMAYDLHGPTWSGPGPVGPLPWQRQATKVLLSKVPRHKVDLGVAGYGYTWPAKGTGTAVTVAQARARVRLDGARAVWRPGAGEWTATLSNGTRMWWSDGRSYDARARLARSLGLHGLALWRLGSADPL